METLISDGIKASYFAHYMNQKILHRVKGEVTLVSLAAGGLMCQNGSPELFLADYNDCGIIVDSIKDCYINGIPEEMCFIHSRRYFMLPVVLAGVVNTITSKLTLHEKEVIRIAADSCGLKPEILSIKTRKEKIVFARWLAWGYLNKISKYKTERLSALFGRKMNHSTVIHGVNKLNGLTEKITGWRLEYKQYFDEAIFKRHELLKNEYFIKK